MASKVAESLLCNQQLTDNHPKHKNNGKTSKKSTTLIKYRRCKIRSSSSSSPIMLVMLFHYVLILLLASNSCCNGFVLDGTQNSFAQFRKWYTGLNGTLELEFKTEQPNGLVMYTDDGGTYDFFELKLVEGALRLRYNLGGGAQIITVGRDLHDGHWHKVQVLRNDERTTLTVDGVSQSKDSRGKEFQFGKFATNSDVFIGGMPNWYNAKLALLALPSVIFEPRFRGSVRNLVYADAPNVGPRRQEQRAQRDVKCGDLPCEGNELLNNKEKVTRGLRNNMTDACERNDPCQHGGICISTDNGPICECRNLEYEGTYCERDKAPSEATFRGTEFLSYDLGQTGGEPIVSAQDAISLYFRTRQPNGLLFYTGHGTDYLNLALRDGGVSLTMGLSNGKQEMHIKPAKIRFDDHQWHKVTIHRRIQEISSITSFCRLVAVVDDVYTDHSHIAGKFTMLSSSRVYVGGAVNPRALSGARVHNNFVGCLRKVEFSADTLRLNLIDLARTGSKLIQVAGRVEYTCPAGDPQDPVTFTTRDSYLTLPSWEVTKQGIISFKFRTNEPNGLIILNTGIKDQKTDFFAVELLNGHIYVHLDLGSGAVKVRASRRRVDEGIWHELSLRRVGREGRVAIDGQWSEFKTPGDSTQLELDSAMYVGGIGPPYLDVPAPAALWTATLRQGYVGCLRDLVLNGKPVDIAAFARQQDSGAVKPSCHVVSNQCTGAVPACQNGGVCTEGWNRPLCDCSATLYTGPTCGRESTTLAFNGSQHMTVWLGGQQGTRTQTEELVLRFKTPRPVGLLLLTSAESNSPDRLEIALVAGRVRASVRLDNREKNLLAGQGVLNDNNWHTVRFSRRASNLRLQVDGATPVRAETILGKHSTLEVKSIHLGGLFHAEEEIQMTSTMPNFIGQMQGFVYNGQRYIDLVKTLGPELTSLPTTTFKLTARFVNSPPGNPYLPVTFRSKHSYVGLPMLKAYSNVFVDFRFKTLEPNGLLFYNGGKRNDFIAVELVNGHIHYVFDQGDGSVTIRDKARVHMNDNRWHSVSIRRPGPRTHTLIVDDSIEVYNTAGNNVHLELEGILYVGGVFKDMYSRLPVSIASRSGFEGCLASVDLADISASLTEDAIVPSSLVVAGCEGPTKCSQNACANRGVCVQQWNAYACECDMTSFTGPTCYDESIAYEFGANKGLIQYQFPPGRQPDTEDDSIALGFITMKTDAVLLRIESSNTPDYLEMEIVEGNVFVVFNVGTNDLPLGDISVKVNDNNYHVVRFVRNGANATLQIDDYNVQTLSPQGHQSTAFNSMANVYVGGKVSRNGRSRIERPFAGVISGLSINGLRLLDLTSDRDPHTTIRGDVQLVTGVLDRNDLQRMQQTPASGYPGVMDDLIFSGAGSGCRGDDEDECTPPFNEGSGDDLITPVYIPPTKQPKKEKGTKTAEDGDTRLCDDEDCKSGSGSGEVTELFTVTSSTGGSTGKSDAESESTSFTKESTQTTESKTTEQESPSHKIYVSQTDERTTPIDSITFSGSGYGSSTTQQQQQTSPSYSSTSLSTYQTTRQYQFSSTDTSQAPTINVWPSSSTSTTQAETTPERRTTTPYRPPIVYTTTTIVHEHEPEPEPEPEPEDPDTENEIIDEPIDERHGERNRDQDRKNFYQRKGDRNGKISEPRSTQRADVQHSPPRSDNYPTNVYNPTSRPKKPGRVTTDTEERTAMIIGIVAGVLIAVILVILLVLWLKSNQERSYKTEQDKSYNYGPGPNAALLGNVAGASSMQYNGSGAAASSGHHTNGGSFSHNGSMRNGSMSEKPGLVAPKPKPRNNKDVKEWYV